MALEQGWDRLAWSVGDRLRKARVAAGYPQIQDLVAASGVPSQSIGPWEAGKRTPTAGALGKVLDVLAPRIGVPVADLERWVRTGTLPA